LVDDVGAIAHRRDSTLQPGSAVASGRRDRQPLTAQVLEIELLQLPPALLQHLQRRVAPSGRRQPALRHHQIELRQMAAADMAGEIARRQLEAIADVAHDDRPYRSRSGIDQP
jgi:hypothetical protein